MVIQVINLDELHVQLRTHPSLSLILVGLGYGRWFKSWRPPPIQNTMISLKTFGFCYLRQHRNASQNRKQKSIIAKNKPLSVCIQMNNYWVLPLKGNKSDRNLQPQSH